MLATVRAGNVIGGGDYSKDRLIPDIYRFFKKKKKILLRNPLAVRPWQHVLEPLSGYLLLTEHLHDKKIKRLQQNWNFGPNASPSNANTPNPTNISFDEERKIFSLNFRIVKKR